MLGIIELRRAEAYLIEAEVVTEIHADLAAGIELDESDQQLAKQLDVSQRVTNRCAALRDDAWCASERAEGLLAGRTHGSGWWVRLRTLQLWAISMSAKDPTTRSLTDRVRHDSAHVVDHLLDEGLAAFPDDWHNRLRLLDYYLHAGLALVDAKLASKQSIANKVREALGDGKPRPKWEAKLLSQRTKNYAEKIRARLKPLLTPSSSAVPSSAAAAE
jgi:hypothetical protein